MRTTVNLDTSAYNFAHAYAGGRGITLSAALNELVHLAEKFEDNRSMGRLEMNEYGYFEVVGSGEVITPEMVKAASEDELV